MAKREVIRFRVTSAERVEIEEYARRLGFTHPDGTPNLTAYFLGLHRIEVETAAPASSPPPARAFVPGAGMEAA